MPAFREAGVRIPAGWPSLVFRAPDRTKRKSQYAEECFAEDAAAHFRGALAAFDEDDRHLLEFGIPAAMPSISSRSGTRIPSSSTASRSIVLQRVARVADEPRRCVAQGHAGHDAYVHRGKVGHQQARHRPVHDVHALSRNASRPPRRFPRRRQPGTAVADRPGLCEKSQSISQM